MGEGGLTVGGGGAAAVVKRALGRATIGSFCSCLYGAFSMARYAIIRAALRFVRSRRVPRCITLGSGWRDAACGACAGAGTCVAGAGAGATTKVVEFASSSTNGIVVFEAGAAPATRGGGPDAGLGLFRTRAAVVVEAGSYVPAGGMATAGFGEAGAADPRLADAEGRDGAGAGVTRRALRFEDGGGATEGFARVIGGSATDGGVLGSNTRFRGINAALGEGALERRTERLTGGAADGVLLVVVALLRRFARFVLFALFAIAGPLLLKRLLRRLGARGVDTGVGESITIGAGSGAGAGSCAAAAACSRKRRINVFLNGPVGEPLLGSSRRTNV